MKSIILIAFFIILFSSWTTCCEEDISKEKTVVEDSLSAPNDNPAGFGALTIGGKGGTVIYVTTLEDNSDYGSLRWAVEQQIPRIIKFKVSGIITLKEALEIKNPYITIDGSDPMLLGQEGITLRDYPINIRTNEVIIRNIRIRLGDIAVRKRIEENNWGRHLGSGDLDCLNIHLSDNILIDHVSMSWSCDEIVSVTNSTNVTIQWCIMSEPLSDPVLHPYGDNHAYASNNSASSITYHHCLFANYVIRGPQFEANDIDPAVLPIPKFEAINNLCYAFTKSGVRYSGAFDFPEKYENKGIKVYFQFIGNSFLNTSDPAKSEIECIDNYGFNMPIYVYFHGNKGLHNEENVADQLALVYMDGKADNKIEDIDYKRYLEQVVDTMLFKPSVPVQIENPDEAAKYIVAYAGCSIFRDSHDLRILENIKDMRPPNIISSQTEVGGWTE